MAAQILEVLKRRRLELKLSFAALSRRSGVSEATLKRMFSGACDSVSLRHVCEIAEAMGVSLNINANTSAIDFCEKVAEQKARYWVGVVQGTSALESQAVDEQAVASMVKRTVHDLVAGSPRRLWSL